VQVRYNVQQVERTVYGEDPVTEWQFDYINVPSLDRGVLIDALITEKYSYASQIGKLALDRTSEEWLAYDAFRQGCYAVANSVIS